MVSLEAVVFDITKSLKSAIRDLLGMLERISEIISDYILAPLFHIPKKKPNNVK